MKTFAITIKINKKGPTEEDYQEICESLLYDEAILVEGLTYEVDSRNNLHLHGWFDLQDGCKVCYKQLIRRYKCHIYIKELLTVDDMAMWLRYLKKTGPNPFQQEQLCIENFYCHYYAFNDDNV